jgi:hypothetical protein
MGAEMKRFALGLVAIALWCLPVAARADCPPCGDQQCLGDPDFPPLLAAKKEGLKFEGWRAEFRKLLDNDGPCRLCLANAPDVFSLLIVRSNGTIESKRWTTSRRTTEPVNVNETPLHRDY